MQNKTFPTGMFLVALSAATWGTIGIAVQVLYHLAPTDAFSIGLWRMLIAVPPLVALSRWLAGASFWRIQRRDLPIVIVMGAAFAAYQVTYFAAIPLVGVAAAVMINICSAPLIVALLSRLFLQEQITRVIGIVLVASVIGTLLLVGGSPEAKSPAQLVLGAALALGAGLSYSVVAITARTLAPRYHPVQPIAIAFAIGSLLLLPVALARSFVVTYPPMGWLLLLHLGLVPTTLGYILYLWGLRSTTATVAAIVALLEPLISAIAAVVFLQEELSPTGALGGTVLLASVAYLYWVQSRPAVKGTVAR